MTNEAIIRSLAKKEEMARMEGISSIIMDLMLLLHKLKICPIASYAFNSSAFIYKYSPLYTHRKNKV